MTDETLLASIKHLLQDDALDWYGRAMAQHRLVSWQAFKAEIRKEFLPSGYEQILRLEAYFRLQGQNESFAKFYRDISALFRFVTPPMQEEEKRFIVKKNMNADYATIVTAARPATLAEMVEVCISYDETRMLLNRQRRFPMPHNVLLEPNFATPAAPNRGIPPPPQHQRFSRVHSVVVQQQELPEEDLYAPQGAQEQPESPSQRVNEEDAWKLQMDSLLEQVNALRTSFGRKNPNTFGSQYQPRYGVPRQQHQQQSQERFHQRIDRDQQREQQQLQPRQIQQRNQNSELLETQQQQNTHPQTTTTTTTGSGIAGSSIPSGRASRSYPTAETISATTGMARTTSGYSGLLELR